jgi:hypothetical protein
MRKSAPRISGESCERRALLVPVLGEAQALLVIMFKRIAIAAVAAMLSLPAQAQQMTNPEWMDGDQHQFRHSSDHRWWDNAAADLPAYERAGACSRSRAQSSETAPRIVARSDRCHQPGSSTGTPRGTKLPREEPDARIAHVRVCGGRGWKHPRLPGTFRVLATHSAERLSQAPSEGSSRTPAYGSNSSRCLPDPDRWASRPLNLLGGGPKGARTGAPPGPYMAMVFQKVRTPGRPESPRAVESGTSLREARRAGDGPDELRG